MKIHEYQARQLLAEAGIAVPAFAVAESVPSAVAQAKKLFDAGIKEIVIKAQVHAGGRGKAGFVKLVSNLKDAEDAASFMFTNKMVSYQTGPEGLVVSKLLIAAAETIEKEYYLAITIDRSRRDHQGADASDPWSAGVSGARIGVPTWIHGQAGRAGRRHHDEARQGFP